MNVNNPRNAVSNILIPHNSFKKAIDKIQQCLNAVESSPEPICVAIIGESRAGKTRILEHIENRYPRRKTEEGMRIPILRVTVPARPTIKGLAEEILLGLGDPIPGKGTISNMTSRIVRLVREVGTIAMMVDEFQHFYDKDKQKVAHDVADWFKVLVDRCRIALITSGLQSSQSVLNLNEQLAGRFMAPVNVPRFDWTDDKLREDFIAILKAFQAGLSNFELPQLDSDEMAFRFYCASGGLIGYVAKILQQATWDAVDRGSPQITLEELAAAYSEAVYRDIALLDLPNPFGRGFVVQKTEDLLAKVRQIGMPTMESPKSRESSGKKRKLSAGETLRA